MTFSAVIATTASASRRPRLLEIIRYIGDFELLEEVVVIWQSTDLPGPEFDHPKLRIFLSRARAVSLARNLGAYQTEGRWIWFLDDDTIPGAANYLNRAKQVLETRNLDFITSNVCGDGVGQVCSRISADISIDEKTIAGNFWEPGLIIAREVFVSIPYDICLGPGCLHGSSEGSDLGLRLLRAGYKGMRVYDLDLNHPKIEQQDDYRNKLFLYALGNGLVAVRHRGPIGLMHVAAKAFVKFLVLGMMLRYTAAKDQLVRLCGLIVGPCLTPTPPMNLDPKMLESADIIQPYFQATHGA